MKLLLHTCCGPCSIFPVDELRAGGAEVTGFFFRHNIHPFSECLRREETLSTYARRIGLALICQEGYDLEGFLRRVVFHEQERCRICFRERLDAAAAVARQGGFDGFSTTLLYSRYQPHGLIREMGEAIGRAAGVPFLYRDFRAGWQQGVAESRRLGMYRQKYCGCIYSEKESYLRTQKGVKAQSAKRKAEE
jgi:predicted adenine nucleotide alpha hydrolase (AANH) superfamily ATPase